MKCTTVRANLAGYMDDAISGSAQVRSRIQVREHLDSCADCREELERFRKLSALLSRVPRSLPPADLATRIRVAAAQSPDRQDAPSRFRRMRDRAEILLDNVFRPITLPVIERNRVTRQVGILLTIELSEGHLKHEATEKDRELTDAFITELYRLYGARAGANRVVDEKLLKTRLQATADRVLGQGVVHAVLIRQLVEQDR